MRSLAYIISALILVATMTCCNAIQSVSQETPLASNEIVKAGNVYCSSTDYGLAVELTPTDAVQAEKLYKVQLFEKGNLRETARVTWSQVQLDVEETKHVLFQVTPEEYNDYMGEDLSHLFTVKVSQYEEVKLPATCPRK